MHLTSTAIPISLILTIFCLLLLSFSDFSLYQSNEKSVYTAGRHGGGGNETCDPNLLFPLLFCPQSLIPKSHNHSTQTTHIECLFALGGGENGSACSVSVSVTKSKSFTDSMISLIILLLLVLFLLGDFESLLSKSESSCSFVCINV